MTLGATCEILSVKREPPHSSHVMNISVGKRYWSQRNLLTHNEASLLHPIFQIEFPYIASSRNIICSLYVYSLSFFFLSIQFHNAYVRKFFELYVCSQQPFYGHDLNGH